MCCSRDDTARRTRRNVEKIDAVRRAAAEHPPGSKRRTFLNAAYTDLVDASCTASARGGLLGRRYRRTSWQRLRRRVERHDELERLLDGRSERRHDDERSWSQRHDDERLAR